uniref:Zinc finger SWIM domain-containing protein 3 n=1 Tax=Cacopsylla melanoneura TaxID=428564 RepID=A0A8D8ZC59_9HEMI
MRFSLSFDAKKLTLTSMINEHNHDISSTIYSALPKQRKLSPQEKDDVKKMMDLRCNKKLVKNYVKSTTGKTILLKNLDNLRNEKQPNQTSGSVLTETVDYLTGLENEGATVKVMVEETDNKLLGIYFQTKQMKNSFSAFPKLLLVDGTYCLNNLQMPLYIFLVINGNGKGEVACSFLLHEESSSNIANMVKTFKAANPDYNKIQCIFTDKDFKERAAIKQELPPQNYCFVFTTL